MHKIVQKHMAAIQAGKAERGNITGIRKLISASFRASAGYSVGGGQAKAPLDDVDALLSAIPYFKPLAVGELHDNGLKVLRNKRHRRALEEVADIAESVTGFRLVDYELRGREGYFVPIWRAESPLGWFDFINIPWQSGGNGPEVLCHERARS